MTSTTIAARIRENCDRYHAGQITRGEWDAEQYRLWRLAQTSTRKDRAVCRLIAPPLSASVAR